MSPIVKDSLRLLTEDQILKAVAGGEQDNLILQELSALVKAYINEVSELAGQGEEPSHLFMERPNCPIEKIALGMAAAAFTAEKKKSEFV